MRLNYKLLLLLLLSMLRVQAQQPVFRDPYPDAPHLRCGTVHAHPSREHGFRAFPARPVEEIKTPIYQDDKIYVFRLAVCITPYAMKAWFKDEKAVLDFWEDLETNLNIIYERDLGIRFEVLRDLNLIAKTWPNDRHYSTTEINKLINPEKYEIGISIMPESGDLAGVAVLGGAYNERNKGSARSSYSHTTIAHELGHMLNAEHTHANRDDSNFTEPENGQSIMSYGFPRTFFSIATIRTIRAGLRGFNYYKTKDRRPEDLVKVGNEKITHPYIEPVKEQRPVIDQRKLKREYVVTRGTYYQFYIPTTSAPDKCLYHAHPYDPSKLRSHANTMQPVYEPSAQPVVMYHPRYEKPHRGKDQEQIVPHSNVYKNGLYTYYLSAFKQGQHDAYITKLRIVDGEPFRITYFNVKFFRDDTAIPGNTELHLKWDACRDLYGPESKVRILLSRDFGRTFPYVIADEEPNSGQWKGVCPYIETNMTDYPGLNRPIRGAVLKVEVIGEAAFALTHEQPYTMRGKTLIETGGFKILVNDSRTARFTNPPKPYEEYRTLSEVPEAQPLTATYRGRTEVVQPAITRKGTSVIYRDWTSKLAGGKGSTYRQVIKILEPEDLNKTEWTNRAKEVQRFAKDLYANLGVLGYPKLEIPESQAFKAAYEAVYDGERVRADIDLAKVETLKQSLKTIGGIEDQAIVFPVSGRKYKIVSYHNSYDHEHFYYLSPNPGGDNDHSEKTSKIETQGAVWSCQELDGGYRFESGGHLLKLAQTGKGYNGFRLIRGYSWGSFGIIGVDRTPRIAQVNTSGEIFSYNQYYFQIKTDALNNRDGSFVSTDFRFVPVDEAYTIYFTSSSWSGITAELTSSRGDTPSRSMNLTPAGNGKYSLVVPKEYATGKVIFKGNGGQQTKPIQLLGRTATYGDSGGQAHTMTLPSGQKYTGLYLDYAVAIPSGIRAYTATARYTKQDGSLRDGYQLRLTQLREGVIPAKTAVILEGTPGQSYTFVETDRYAKHGLNHLIGSTEELSAQIRDKGHYLYFDLSKPQVSGDQVRYTKLADDGASIAAHTAYYPLAKYEGDYSSYQVTTITLALSELDKPADTSEPLVPTPDPEQPGSDPSDPSSPLPNQIIDPYEGGGDFHIDGTNDSDNKQREGGRATLENRGNDEGHRGESPREIRRKRLRRYVYTLTGQIVGRIENFKDLPAGLYIIDGKKVIKH